ncbi:MAG TPA: acetyl-CoA C-acyltransferase, partial [Polyangiaceae bacterium]|nr:acetyl-CoA C-acyltransferase [Polyangiaceae bacterium]
MAFPLNVVIASSVRTAVGRALKGTLRQTRPDDLAAWAMQAAVAKVPGLRPEDVQDVVLGCAMPEAEQGLNIARNAVFVAKFPNSAPGETVNRFCASGLQAIVHAGLQVHAGLADVVIGGGVESMSMVPMGGNKVSLNPSLMDTYPESYISMGHTAERVASRFSVSRVEQDAFAARSHERALAAIAAGHFKDE